MRFRRFEQIYRTVLLNVKGLAYEQNSIDSIIPHSFFYSQIQIKKRGVRTFKINGVLFIFPIGTIFDNFLSSSVS